MEFLSHIGCLILGGVLGFAAAAMCAASGHREIVTCRRCRHSSIERHTGDDVLTCWYHKGYGHAVSPCHFCGYGEEAE